MHMYVCPSVHEHKHMFTHILQLHNETTGVLDSELPSLHSFLYPSVQLLSTFFKGFSQTMGLHRQHRQDVAGEGEEEGEGRERRGRGSRKQRTISVTTHSSVGTSVLDPVAGSIENSARWFADYSVGLVSISISLITKGNSMDT